MNYDVIKATSTSVLFLFSFFWVETGLDQLDQSISITQKSDSQDLVFSKKLINIPKLVSIKAKICSKTPVFFSK